MVPEGHPVDKLYWTTDPATQLVHVARSYDAESYTDVITVNCTGCNIEVSYKWPFSTEPQVVTCLTCLEHAP